MPVSKSVYSATIHLDGPAPDALGSAVTYHALNPDMTYSPNLSDVYAERAHTFMANWFAGSGLNSWVYRGVTYTEHNAAGIVVDSYNVSGATVGSVAAAALPPGNCLHLDKILIPAGAPHRNPNARWYWPGVGEGNVAENGYLPLATAAALGTLFTQIPDGLVAAAGSGQPHRMVAQFKKRKSDLDYSYEAVAGFQCRIKTTYLRKRSKP